MIISCTPSGIVNRETPARGITSIADAGFEHVLLDLTIACSPGQLENVGKPKPKETRDQDEVLVSEYPEELHNVMKPMLEQCAKKQLHCSIAMSPYLMRNTKRDDLNGLIQKLAEESIKICGQIGCRFLIIRPLFAGIPDNEVWERNREYYLYLANCAKEYDVQILLENQCKDMNGRLVRGICADGYTAAEWVDRLNAEAGEERFGFCMDVGACNLCGQNMYDFIMPLGNRLKAVILRDCDGNTESDLLPFTTGKKRQTQTDWFSLIRGLREIGFDGELVINFAETARAFSHLFRPQLVKLAKLVADYFKWQIEIEKVLKKYPSRVLFGAGNMCKNYMEYYGEKYPPLFTCDNNKKLWDTEFCGLAVKAPEVLKDLPDDCAVFICNIFYREIETQLRQMGIKNPIEFFNDECMPDLDFDSLEDRER